MSGSLGDLAHAAIETEIIMKTPALWFAVLLVGASLAATGALAVDNVTSRDAPVVATETPTSNAANQSAGVFILISISIAA